jgi:hypothetical protein
LLNPASALVCRCIDALLVLRLDDSAQLIVSSMVFGLNAACESVGSGSVAITRASIVHGRA